MDRSIWRRFYVLILLVALISGCSPSESELAERQEKYSGLYAAITGDAASDSDNLDDNIKAFSDSISEKYGNLDYLSYAREPDEHKGELINFECEIVDVLGSMGWKYIAAFNGNKNDLISIGYVSENNSRLLIGDIVSVEGLFMGSESCKLNDNSSIFIPHCAASNIRILSHS